MRGLPGRSDDAQGREEGEMRRLKRPPAIVAGGPLGPDMMEHLDNTVQGLRVPKGATLSRDDLAQMLDYLMVGVSSGQTLIGNRSGAGRRFQIR